MVSGKRVLKQLDKTSPHTVNKSQRQSIENDLTDCTRVDVSHQSLFPKKLHEKIGCLENEVKRLQSVVEQERSSNPEIALRRVNYVPKLAVLDRAGRTDGWTGG
ncbi:hypothetical protein KIN20_033654 [Parelaphostrongylus tenuis]|uniref:Uncharacterized protein n=1 Tax=Parelaphostrongylus tenuis TaxID=148309 RepID=A0AAD5R8G2_PARTN|nr:hypothetical protein KIN20_033654 [Parelaphostrongylus tenuis]